MGRKYNIFLTSTKNRMPYKAQSMPIRPNLPVRNPEKHAKFIEARLRACQKEATLTRRQVAAIRYKDGTYLEFSGAPHCDLVGPLYNEIEQLIKK